MSTSLFDDMLHNPPSPGEKGLRVGASLQHGLAKEMTVFTDFINKTLSGTFGSKTVLFDFDTWHFTDTPGLYCTEYIYFFCFHIQPTALD